jgi:hypothetical protein
MVTKKECDEDQRLAYLMEKLNELDDQLLEKRDQLDKILKSKEPRTE